MITVDLHGMMADSKLVVTTVRLGERRVLLRQGRSVHGMAGAPEVTGIQTLFTKSVLHFCCKINSALNRHDDRSVSKSNVRFTLTFADRLKFFLARLFLVNHLQFGAVVRLMYGSEMIG